MQKRVFVLGIDGMDPKLTEDLMARGELPAFKALAEKGSFAPLATVNPAQSPAAWASMGTGLLPFHHGVSDFIIRKDNGYVPDLSLFEQNASNFLQQPQNMYVPPVAPELFFFDQLAQHDIPSHVIRWPMTFPRAGASTGLSGLGTPDLLGALGRYTLMTSTPFEGDIKGSVEQLTHLEGGHWLGTIRGPMRNSLTGKKESFAELQFEILEGGKLAVNSGDDKFTLAKGELSPWFTLEFGIGFGAKASGMTAIMPLAIEAERLILYVAPLQINPKKPFYPLSEPREFAKALTREIGFYHTLGLAEDTNALRDQVIDEQQFLDLCERIMTSTEEMLWHTLSHFEKGFRACVFDTTDRIQHMFWRYQDAGHPLHGHAQPETFGDTIRNYYKRMDQILSKVSEELSGEGDTLFVVSDHGFTNYRKSLHINRFLAEKGFLTLVDGHTSSEGLFQNVDWSKTKAFALGFSQVFVNVKGRDKHGIVAESDVEALKCELTAALHEFHDPDTGESVLQGVYDTQIEFGGTPKLGPELVLGTKPGYRFSWQTALGAVPEALIEWNDNKWSGDHCVDAAAVPGVIFCNKRLAEGEKSLLDLAPTVLKLFGMQKQPNMVGKSLL